MLAYTSKCLNVEYAIIILNVPDVVVHRIKSLYNFFGRCIHNTVKHLRWSVLQKHNAWVQVHNQNIFRAFRARGVKGGGGLWNWGISINISSKTQEKEAPQENILELFLLNALKTASWMENSTWWWIQLGPFFLNSGHFFRFFKWAGEAPPLLPSCAPVNVV